MLNRHVTPWTAYSVVVLFSLSVILPLSDAQSEAPLQDATALVDKLFTYSLDSIDKTDKDFKVVESGCQALPSWLSYHKTSRTLHGVPEAKDRGTYIISANGDRFAITVRAHTEREVAQSAHSTSKPVKCKPQDSITQVKVLLNTDITALSPLKKVNLITDLSCHLSLRREHVSLRVEQPGDRRDAATALVLGLGNQKRNTSRLSTVVHWLVGCGPVKSHQMEILERLEASAKNGELSRKLGQGVSSWQVTINRPASAPGKRRLKRKVGTTATPSPESERTTRADTTRVMPTATVGTPTIKESSTPVQPTAPTAIPTTKPASLVTTVHLVQPQTTLRVTEQPHPHPSTLPPSTQPLLVLSTQTPPEPTTQSHPEPTTQPPPPPTTLPPTNLPPTTLPPTPQLTSPLTTKLTTFITKRDKSIESKPLVPGDSTGPNVGPSSTSKISRRSRSTIADMLTTVAMVPPSPPSPPPPPLTMRPTSQSASVAVTTGIKTSVEQQESAVTMGVSISTTAESTLPPTLPPPIPPPPKHANRPPMLRPSIETTMRLEMISGQLFEWTLPKDLFRDPEGDRIKLAVLDYLERLPPWVMVDSINNRLLALPLDDDVGTNKLMLKATDAKGKSSKVDLTVIVTESDATEIPQMYKMYVDTSSAGSSVDARSTRSSALIFHLVYTLSANLKEAKSRGKIKLQKISREEDLVLEFGISIPGYNSSSCPLSSNRDDLLLLRNMSIVSLRIYTYTRSVRVLAVRSRPLHPCLNSRPKLTINNSIVKKFKSQLRAESGQLLEVKVPDELFTDQEDINLRYMELDLRFQGVEISGQSWVRLDKTSNTIVGLPWDIKDRQRFQYSLDVRDFGGKTFSYAIEIAITYYEFTPSNLFTVTVDEVYSKFANHLPSQIKIYNILRHAFRDAGRPTVIVNSIKPGSVIIGFNLYNPPSEGRPVCGSVRGYRDAVFAKDGNVTISFIDAFESFAIKKAGFVPLGECEDVLKPMEAVVKPRLAESNASSPGPQSSGFNLLFVIIPILALVLIIVVVIIVIVLVKRRWYGDHDISNSDGTYIEKGVPVVFDGELNGVDKKEPAETEPLMQNTQPKPPAYPQNGNGEMTPLNAGRRASGDHRYTLPTPLVSEHDNTDR